MLRLAPPVATNPFPNPHASAAVAPPRVIYNRHTFIQSDNTTLTLPIDRLSTYKTFIYTFSPSVLRRMRHPCPFSLAHAAALTTHTLSSVLPSNATSGLIFTPLYSHSLGQK